MARLSIQVAPTAAPTPVLAAIIEDWHAEVAPQETPLVVPVRQPDSLAVTMRSWLARFWPTIDTQIPVCAYIAQLVEVHGYLPRELPSAIQPWAHYAARGLLEHEFAANKGTTGVRATPLRGAWSGPPRGPMDQFSALVVQAKGPSDPMFAFGMRALAFYFHAGDAPEVDRITARQDWPDRIAALVA